MKNNPLKNQSILNKKGVTLIELLVVLVICGIVIGGIYKVFIAQTRAYTVQDQVAEIQQDVRGAMEIMVRDIRMAGFKNRSFDDSGVISNGAIGAPLNNTSITVNYEYIPSVGMGSPTVSTVTYAWPGPGGDLTRTLNGVSETLLSNVTNLNFSYGIDANGDGIIDNIDPVSGIVDNTAAVPNNTFVAAANVGTAKVLAIYVTLTANPASTGLSPVDSDVTKMVSPRTLTSVVTPRNMFFKRYQAY